MEKGGARYLTSVSRSPTAGSQIKKGWFYHRPLRHPRADIHFGRPLDSRFHENNENGMQRGKNKSGRS